MAVKAVAMIRNFDLETNGDLNLYLDINSFGNVATAVHFGPVDPGSTDLTLDNNLKAFVKQYAIDNWSVTFGLFDTTRILFALNSVI